MSIRGGTKTHVRGDEDISRRFARLQAAARGRALGEAALAAGKVIVKRAEEIAGTHRITGNLQDEGIAADIAVAGPDSAKVHVGYTKKGFYGDFLETGVTIEPLMASKKRPDRGWLAFQIGGQWIRTKGPITIPATPMIRPATDEKKDEAVRAFRDHLRAAGRGIR